MKARRSLLTLVAVFFVALACAFGVLNFKSKASAAEYADVPTATAVAEEGFELTEASIRLTDGKAAIRFSATVTEDYAGAEFVATITYNGKTLAAPFGAAPEFVEGVATLNAYLNFGNASEEVLAQAITAEFTPAIYAKIADACIQAKGSETAARSMRVVANDAYLNWEEGVGYEKEDVAELGYFTNATRSDKEFAVVDTENTLYVNIPGAPANAAEIYVDDVKVAATYDEETDKYTVADFATAGKYITIFAEDGKAYSSNIATGAIAISNLAELKAIIGVEGALTGYYVLTSDIDVGTWTYVDNELRGGTFNGLDYKLTNYRGSAVTSHYALIHESFGGTVKNLLINTNYEGVQNNGGVIIGFVMGDVAADPENGVEAVTYPDTILDNVVCYIQANNHNGGAISVANHKVIVKDSIFVMGKNNNMTNPGGALVYNNSNAAGIVETENTIVVTSPFSQVAHNANKVHGADVFKTVGALYNADKAGTYEVTDAQWAKLTSLKAFLPLDANNITTLQDATEGYYVITEDIDMKPITLVKEEGVGERSRWYESSRDFVGVLDGADHILYNVFLDSSNAGMYGGFLSMGYTNPFVTNFNVVAHHTGERGGFFGRSRSFTINESVIVVGGAMSYGAAGICGVIDGSIKMKDSFYYHGGAGYSNQGWFASTEGLAGRPGFDNVYVVNASTNSAPITGYTNETAIKTFATCGAVDANQVAAVAGQDYFYFTDGADYLALTENTLPANVQAAVSKIAIIELCEDTLAYAKVAPTGFWYLTDDLDVSEKIDNRPIFALGGVMYGSDGGRMYYGANIQLDGNGFAITGVKGVSAGNSAGIIGEGTGNIIFRNITFKGTMAGSGSGSCFLVGLIRENKGQNKITLENVFIDLQAAGAYNGGIIVAWSPVNTTIYMDRVFINIANYDGPWLFVGHAWTGTINVNDVFVAGVPADVALSKESAVVYKDYNGNTITPGGDGENDFACTLTASLADLKALNDGDDWTYVVETFAALDPEFFVAE